MKPIAYYITAHGYGHGTRSCDILRALYRIAPEQAVIVTTDLPRDFLNSRLAECHNLSFRQGAFDVGLVQKDSIQSDLPQTLEKLEALYACEEKHLVQEQNFFKENHVELVVADIPAIPLAAAQRSLLPHVAIGNFSWDWIYADYAKTDFQWEFFVEKFRTIYKQTDLLLRLPFAPPMEIFPHRKQIPLLASPGTSCREKISASCRKNQPAIDKPWVLLSFTSLDLPVTALERIRMHDEYEFFCVQPMEFPLSCIHAIDRHSICFADVMASCDIVISKPGFGLVSECIVNKKPLIYSDRSHFAEYPYLVDGIKTYLKNVHLPVKQLYAGDFFNALVEIKTAPEPEGRLASGGAEMIAKELLSLL